MDVSRSLIDSLPNELWTTIFAEFRTNNLLPILSVNRRLHALAVREFYRRLVAVASLPDNDLILECYHPSAKISTPYLPCRFLRTKILDAVVINDECPRYTDLRLLYSSFRPGATQPAWQLLLSQADDEAANVQEEDTSNEEDQSITEYVFLDEGERFSQLCTVTNVVKEGPRPGFFVSHANVSDGVIRVFRQWLAEMATHSTHEGDLEMLSSIDQNVLWVDASKSVGLRFKVTPGPSQRMPLISGPDDEPPVTYTLVYKELLVQTNRLLRAVEAAEVRDIISHSGLDIILAL